MSFLWQTFDQVVGPKISGDVQTLAADSGLNILFGNPGNPYAEVQKHQQFEHVKQLVHDVGDKIHELVEQNE